MQITLVVRKCKAHWAITFAVCDYLEGTTTEKTMAQTMLLVLINTHLLLCFKQKVSKGEQEKRIEPEHELTRDTVSLMAEHNCHKSSLQ